MRCCNNDIQIVDVIPLDNLDIYIDRKIKIGVCDNCHKIKYELSELDTIKNAIIINRGCPKRIKDINQWVKSLEALKIDSPIKEIKKGTKAGMSFIFGVNKQINNKCVQIGYDFNGTERHRKELI